MKITDLAAIIENTQNQLQTRALQTVNQMLVVRNWLIGFYIIEFEQNGEDRAAYGKRILQTLAEKLKAKRLKGFSYSGLKLMRQFYQSYPHFKFFVVNRLPESFRISQPLVGQLQKSDIQSFEISQPMADQFISPPDQLLVNFSFRHFVALIGIHNIAKRYFYEQQTIKCNWNARQLERQIETLYYERTGLSTDKTAMLEDSPKGNFKDLVKQTLNDPYIFEFTGFKELPKYSEKDLETALLNKIEEFLMELGHGFCFEGRQKRITIEGEHDRIDLVFYHRIKKCHVLIDLKIKKFRKEYVGQMIYYLNYYRDNLMTEGDNPPIGIILCTEKNEAKVKYATSGIDTQIFISKYMVELPSEAELLKILTDQTNEI